MGQSPQVHGDGSFSYASGGQGFFGWSFDKAVDQTVVLDFDGDGKQDLFMYRPGERWTNLLRSNGDGTFTRLWDAQGFYSWTFADSRDRVQVLDYNGDGKQDLFVYEPGNRWTGLLRSNGDGTYTSVAGGQGFYGYDFTQAADRVVVLDANGDGKSDLFFYRPMSGQGWTSLLQSNGDATFTSLGGGQNYLGWYFAAGYEQLVLPLDCTGDGKQDLVFSSRWATDYGLSWGMYTNVSLGAADLVTSVENGLGGR
jgi:1-phosphatidylinositol phosphodiesterase